MQGPEAKRRDGQWALRESWIDNTGVMKGTVGKVV